MHPITNGIRELGAVTHRQLRGGMPTMGAPARAGCAVTHAGTSQVRCDSPCRSDDMDKPDVNAAVWLIAEAIPAWPVASFEHAHDTPDACWLLLPDNAGMNVAARFAQGPLVRFSNTSTHVDLDLTATYLIDWGKAAFVAMMTGDADEPCRTDEVSMAEWSQARAWLDHQRIYGDTT